VDTAGNVYVTGSTTVSDGTSDFLTIKYDPNGKELWEARYDGPLHRDDVTAHIALDSAGNVFVAGQTAGRNGNAGDWDFVTVKYDSSGNQLWAAFYNGPANGVDAGARLAVDAAGNAYVTGSSEGTNGNQLATIKYDSDGNQLWATRYGLGGPTAITVDNESNVYVTGYDFITVKYDAGGKQVWAAHYQVPGGSDSSAYALAIDRSTNVFITGSSSTPTSAGDYVTVKYNAAGTQLWVARYHGPTTVIDSALATALDFVGNVIVTGKSMDSGGGCDFTTIKYDSNGRRLWINHFAEPAADYYNGAARLAVDDQGNAYVVVSSTDGGLSYDFAIVKYGTNGSPIWVARYNGSGTGQGFANNVVVDSARNVYVTGASSGGATGLDYLTVKYVQYEPIATRLTWPTFLASGAFQFTLNSETGKVLHIQASPDLVSWTTLTNFFSPANTNLVTDPSAPNFKQRFYRAWTE
jgi:hypothetical protein